jgi:hypothetical protein
MKLHFLAPLGLALALPQLAAAQATNFLTVAKIGCVPDKVTRCSSDDKCESRDASAKDKGEVLVIDFAEKKASVRSGDKVQPFGTIVGDQVTGEERRFSIQAGTDVSKAIAITLSRSGKLTLLLDGNRHRAEATCTPAS